MAQSGYKALLSGSDVGEMSVKMNNGSYSHADYGGLATYTDAVGKDTDFSIVFWFKPDTTINSSSSNMWLFSLQNSNKGLYVGVKDGLIICYMGDSPITGGFASTDDWIKQESGATTAYPIANDKFTCVMISMTQSGSGTGNTGQIWTDNYGSYHSYQYSSTTAWNGTDSTINYGGGGATNINTLSYLQFAGQMGPLWIINEAIDFSSASNRQIFTDANNNGTIKPMGSRGQVRSNSVAKTYASNLFSSIIFPYIDFFTGSTPDGYGPDGRSGTAGPKISINGTTVQFRAVNSGGYAYANHMAYDINQASISNITATSYIPSINDSYNANLNSNLWLKIENTAGGELTLVDDPAGDNSNGFKAFAKSGPKINPVNNQTSNQMQYTGIDLVPQYKPIIYVKPNTKQEFAPNGATATDNFDSAPFWSRGQVCFLVPPMDRKNQEWAGDIGYERDVYRQIVGNTYTGVTGGYVYGVSSPITVVAGETITQATSGTQVTVLFSETNSYYFYAYGSTVLSTHSATGNPEYNLTGSTSGNLNAFPYFGYQMKDNNETISGTLSKGDPIGG